MLPEADLAGFDQALYQTSQEIYDLAADAKDVNVFGTFHFVRNYRKRGTRKQLPFLYYDACRARGTAYGNNKH